MGLRLGRIEGADKLDQALEVIGPARGWKRPDVFEGEVADDLVDAPGMAFVLGVRLLHCVLHPYDVVWMTIRRRVASVNTVPYRWACGQGSDSPGRLDRSGAEGTGTRRSGGDPGGGAGDGPRRLQGRLLLALQGAGDLDRGDARRLGAQRGQRRDLRGRERSGGAAGQAPPPLRACRQRLRRDD